MRRARRVMPVIAVASLVISACGGVDTAEPAPTTIQESAPTTPTSGIDPTPVTIAPSMEHGGDVDLDLLVPAFLGAVAFQDIAVAEAAGWVSTIDTLGCFEKADEGGMGVHWLNETLFDAELDPAQPEALVYELDAEGEVVGLVGHEYLVPIEAWTEDDPPSLFGLDLHEHPVLPFWILHAYLWKDNPSGMFNDWNPTVRMCPDGVGVFGVDLP